MRIKLKADKIAFIVFSYVTMVVALDKTLMGQLQVWDFCKEICKTSRAAHGIIGVEVHRFMKFCERCCVETSNIVVKHRMCDIRCESWPGSLGLACLIGCNAG